MADALYLSAARGEQTPGGNFGGISVPENEMLGMNIMPITSDQPLQSEKNSEVQYNILLVGSAISTLLLAITLLITRLSYGSFGAIHSFPPIYFVAIALSVLLSIWGTGISNKIAFYNLILIVIALWLIPSLVGIVSPDYHTYEDYGYVNNIIETGKVNAQDFARLTWPGWAIFGTSLVTVTGIEAEWLLGIFPFAVELIVALATLFILTKTLAPSIENRRVRNIAVIITTLANWNLVNNFAGHVIAYVLLTELIVFIGIHLIRKEDNFSFGKETIIIVIIFGSIVVSHLLVTLVAIAFLALITLRRWGKLLPIFFIATVLCFTWILYWGGSFFSSYIQANKQFLLHFIDALKESIFGVAANPESFNPISPFRLYYGVAFVVLAIIGIIVWFFKERHSKPGQYMFAVILSSVLLIPANIASANTYVTRLYALSRMGIGYFIAYLGRYKLGLVMVIIFILIAIPANLWVRYGFHEDEYLPDSYLSGLSFFHEHTAGGAVAEVNPRPDGDPFPYGAYENRTLYTHITHMDGTPEALEGILTDFNLPRPLYCVVADIADIIYERQILKTGVVAETYAWIDSSMMSLVYNSSNSVRIWIEGSYQYE
ncbi:hypothetical protein ACFLUL_03060 [Chloroflexota bacterium]